LEGQKATSCLCESAERLCTDYFCFEKITKTVLCSPDWMDPLEITMKLP